MPVSEVTELYRRVGGLESDVRSLTMSTATHAGQIRDLELTSTRILGEIEKNTTTLHSIEKSLEVVAQITEIKNAVVFVGRIMEKVMKGIKYAIVVAALVAAAYTAYRNGDITGAMTYLNQLLALDVGA